MNKLSAYWEFHKSTLLINVLTSVALALVMLPDFLKVFPLFIMSLGTLISLFYKEITRKNEYYFYFNLGIPKAALIAVNVCLNILTAFLLLWIFSYVKHS